MIGRRKEREFFNDVIGEISGLRELKGVELFSTLHDYRGEGGGIAALFTVNHMLSDLKLTHRPVEAPSPGGLEPGPADAVSEVEHRARRELAEVTEDLIVQLSDYERAWISLAEFGSELRRQVPGFTPQSYGGRNLISVLRTLDWLEFDERGAGPAKSVYIRMRRDTDGEYDTHQIRYEEDVSNEILSILTAYAPDGGWVFLGTVGHLLKKHYPEFQYASFGAQSLHDYISNMPWLEIDERGPGHSKTYVRVVQDEE